MFSVSRASWPVFMGQEAHATTGATEASVIEGVPSRSVCLARILEKQNWLQISQVFSPSAH
jgi:hypothetical protein